MTNNEINKAIATHIFGFEDYDMLLSFSGAPERKLYGATKFANNWTPVPDYCNDLNAMREALQIFISTEEQNKYISNIAEVCWVDVSRSYNQVVFNQLTTTARQQAEAFLKTIGKWEE
jgi:hypothetical protein